MHAQLEIPMARSQLEVHCSAHRKLDKLLEQLLLPGPNSVAKEPKYPTGALRPHEGNFKATQPNKGSHAEYRPRHQRRWRYDLSMWRLRNEPFGDRRIQSGERPRGEMQSVRLL